MMQILTFDILNQELKHTHTHSLYLAISVGIQIGYHLTLRECQIPIKMYTRIYVDSTICCLNVSVDFTWFLHKYLHAILSFVKFNNHYCFFGHFVCWFFPSILIYLNLIPCGRNTQSFSCTERVTHFNTIYTILPEYSLYTPFCPIQLIHADLKFRKIRVYSELNAILGHSGCWYFRY